MENVELESLLSDLNSDRVVRRSSLSGRERILQAICAFANDLPNHQKPGVLFVGVHDDGRCAGLPITDDLLLTLSSMRSDGNTVPFPSLIVQKRILLGCEVAVVLVEPSDAPPLRYQGRVWVRIGPRRAVASPEEERRLTEKRRARDLPFDLHTVASATLQDLDLDLFRRTYLPASVANDVLDQNQRSLEEQLTSLRLAATNGLTTPTVIGILVAGRDPLRFLPGAYVQFLRLDGPGLADPVIDGAEISGPLPELLRAVEEKLQAHLETARDLTSGQTEAVHPDYPMVALQQLTRNAILHRTYEGTAAPVRVSWFSDRVEILSPGGPYGLVNRNNFGRPGITDYRNPHLAEAMRNLGYVQKFGVGIALARQALLGNANPPLEFRVEDTHVLAVIGRRN
jgi:ATP-dependent DNA helicase RecG